MEGRDGAPKGDLRLRDPAEVAQLPQLYVSSGEMWQNDAVQVDWLGKPLSKVLLYVTALAVGMLKWVWL